MRLRSTQQFVTYCSRCVREYFVAVFSSVSTNSNMSIMSNFHLWLWINSIWGACIFANSSGLFGNMLVYCSKLLPARAKLARNISHYLLTFFSAANYHILFRWIVLYWRIWDRLLAKHYFLRIFFIILLSLMNLNWRQKEYFREYLRECLIRNAIWLHFYQMVFEKFNITIFIYIYCNIPHIEFFIIRSHDQFQTHVSLFWINIQDYKYILDDEICHLCWYALDTSTFREALVSYLNLKQRQFYERNFF